ncbi:RusA family crossover junction endodeoxyribonuclease [Saccharococcus caldoxylosilyticus]|uniref:RusA family crossover junction endodeoxyribonuclease n=1 Tax=Saccharococcus caldoxylosilyticus TaxID=81408 RepID=UPI003D335C85
MIRFTVYGEPVAQGRPRATMINGHIRMYDPKKSSDFKNYVRLVAADYRPDKLLEGPILVTVKVYKKIPKSFSKKKKAAAEVGQLRPTSKPDVDNYAKSIKDALKNVIWKDDSQVVDLHISKWYSETPRVEITIVPLEEQQQALSI